VEETLNELLELEAEKLTQAARYERNEARQGYRSGHYSRNLAGVSVRRVEDITEALWGSKVSPATLSELSKKAAREKAESVAEELRTMKLSEVAKKVETGRSAAAQWGNKKYMNMKHLVATLEDASIAG